MVVVPLEQGIAHNGWKTLRLIAADMDGTLGSPALQQNKDVSRLESLRCIICRMDAAREALVG